MISNNRRLRLYGRYCIGTFSSMFPSYVNHFTLKRMILIQILISVLIVKGLPVFAQSLSLDELIGKVQATYDRTADFKAAFVQEATIKSMGKTTREEGTVYLKKPERMLWDYAAPSMKKLVINPQKAWLYVPDEKIVYVQDARVVLSSKMTIRFLTGIGRLTDDFLVSFPAEGSTDEAGNYRILLKPQEYEAGIKQLLLIVKRGTYHIVGCVFTDLYENETRLTFDHIIFNADPPDELFEFTPPPGVTVQDIGGK